MISAVILTKNEAKNIGECIAGLKWCDEIIVIDDRSTDDTVNQISKIKDKNQNLNIKILTRELNENFNEQRNYGLDKAKGDWVFFVDADERVSEKLKEEICSRLRSNNNINGYYFKRIDNFLGKWLKYGEIGGVRILRLARKNTGKWVRRVDEIWNVGGKTDTLNNPLLHYSHKSLDEFIESINQRSSLNAQVFYDGNIKLNFLEWLKPLFKFINSYFFKLGFLDGIQGFVFAVFMSLHSFMVRGKLYLLWKRNENDKKN